MNLVNRIAAATFLAVAGFWITKFGGWLGSLTTVRTPFYFTLNTIGAWVVAFMVFGAVLIETKR